MMKSKWKMFHDFPLNLWGFVMSVCFNQSRWYLNTCDSLQSALVFSSQLPPQQWPQTLRKAPTFLQWRCSHVPLRGLLQQKYPKNKKATRNPYAGSCKDAHHQGDSVFPKVRIFFRYAGCAEYMLIFWVRRAEQLFIFKNSHSNKRQAEQWLPLTAPAAVVTSRTSRRSASTTFAPRSWKKWDHEKLN